MELAYVSSAWLITLIYLQETMVSDGSIYMSPVDTTTYIELANLVAYFPPARLYQARHLIVDQQKRGLVRDSLSQAKLAC